MAVLGFSPPSRRNQLHPDVVVVQGSALVLNQVKALLVPRFAERFSVVVLSAQTHPTARFEEDLQTAPLIVYVADPSHSSMPSWIVGAMRQNLSAGVLDIGESSAQFGYPGVSVAAGVDSTRILTVGTNEWPIVTKVSGLMRNRGVPLTGALWKTLATVTTDSGATDPYLMAKGRSPGHPLVVVGSWSTNPLLLATVFRGVDEATGLPLHQSARVLWMIGPITASTNLAHLRRVVGWFAQHHQTYVLAVNPLDGTNLTAMTRVLRSLQHNGGEIVLAPNERRLASTKPRAQILSRDFLALIRARLYPVALVVPQAQNLSLWSAGSGVRFSVVFGTIDGMVLPVVAKEQGVTVIPQPIAIGSATPQEASQLIGIIAQRQIAGAAVVSVEVPNFVSLTSLNQSMTARPWWNLATYPMQRLTSVVRSPWAIIDHHHGTTTVKILDHQIDRVVPNPLTTAQQVTRFLSWAIALLVSGVVFQFLRQIRRLRKTRGHRLFHERVDHKGDGR